MNRELVLAWPAAYFGLGSMEWRGCVYGGGQAWRWPEHRVTGLQRPGSQMCPFGPSLRTVRASIPAKTLGGGAWKILGAGSQDLEVAQTHWAQAACSGGFLSPHIG